MALDLTSLWNFKDPAQSEQRFIAALADASVDDALILRTQIARTHGIRKQFDVARDVLKVIEPQLPAAGAEVNARYWLEWGRTWASGSHPMASMNDAAKAQATKAFERSLGVAKAARLDGLAIDAVHMLAFVDTAPADQLKWAQTALAISLASDQPVAKAWEASIRNNIGMALHGLNQLPEALAQFELALAIRQQGSNADATRVARWMVAWTLRRLMRSAEALAIQTELEAIGDASNSPDPHVMDELAALHAERGDEPLAAAYRARAKLLRGG